ncbi:MAG: hypothetical protein E4G98_06015 [Promethearchaeota archaeon]|nr:MAG: hypothetical protein E4G98_06015 [Candidatus Lokiarchaeota archaeon]
MNNTPQSLIRDLHEFAENMKKSLLFGFLFIGILILAILGIFLGNSLLLVVLFIIPIIIVYFEYAKSRINQLRALYRAKKEEYNQKITQAFYFLIIVLVFELSSLITVNNHTVGVVINIGRLLPIIGYKKLVEITESEFNTTEKVKKGFHIYWISSIIMILFEFVASIMGNTLSSPLGIVFAVIGFLIMIISLIGELILANGFLLAFNLNRPIQASSPRILSASNEPN